MNRSIGGSASPVSGPRSNGFQRSREDMIAAISRKYVTRFGKEQASSDEIKRCIEEYMRTKPEPLKLTRKDFITLDLFCMKRVQHVMKKSGTGSI